MCRVVSWVETCGIDFSLHRLAFEPSLPFACVLCRFRTVRRPSLRLNQASVTNITMQQLQAPHRPESTALEYISRLSFHCTSLHTDGTMTSLPCRCCYHSTISSEVSFECPYNRYHIVYQHIALHVTHETHDIEAAWMWEVGVSETHNSTTSSSTMFT